MNVTSGTKSGYRKERTKEKGKAIGNVECVPVSPRVKSTRVHNLAIHRVLQHHESSEYLLRYRR